jgi:hypothetical protein
MRPSRIFLGSSNVAKQTIVYVDLGNPVVPTPWSYNQFSGTSIQQLSPDLKDGSNTSTGYTLDITAPFTGNSGHANSASSGAGSWPEPVFDFYNYMGATTATLQVGGLTDGDTYKIELSGHRGSVGRNTVYNINGGTSQTYIVAAGSTPNAPLSFSGIVSGTTLVINSSRTDVFGYLNGFKMTITSASGGGGGGSSSVFKLHWVINKSFILGGGLR